MSTTATQPRLLSVKDVALITGLGKSTVWRRVKEGTFPAAIKYGPRTTRWRAEEIDNWIETGGGANQRTS